MKALKVICIAMMVCSMLMMAVGSASAEIYPATAKVITLDYDSDIVVVETFTGFQFAFEGCEDWMIGDCVSLIMEDNDTASIYDDEIIMAQYSAWLLIDWQE